MGKYQPLSAFFQRQSASKVRKSFAEIEAILGFRLPKSAKEYEAWWSNNGTGHSHARAWLAEGWRTEEVDLASRKVTFVRAENGRTAQKRTNPYGCMRGTIVVSPDTDLTAPTEDWNAERGLLLNE